MLLTLLIALGPLAEGLQPASVTASSANSPSCYEGTIGSGPRLRRIILEKRTDSAVLHLYSRPRAERRLGDRTAAQDTASLVLWKSRWFKSLYHHDPAPFLVRVRAPIFALIGELDLQVPVEQSVARFEALFAGPRRSQLTLSRMPGINHMLQRAKSGRMEEYMEITETIAPDVLRSMDQWLAGVVPIPPKP